MRIVVPFYESGEEIRVGDRVTYGGTPGRIVFVIDTRSYSSEYSEEDWSSLGTAPEFLGRCLTPAAVRAILNTPKAAGRNSLPSRVLDLQKSSRKNSAS